MEDRAALERRYQRLNAQAQQYLQRINELEAQLNMCRVVSRSSRASADQILEYQERIKVFGILLEEQQALLRAVNVRLVQVTRTLRANEQTPSQMLITQDSK